MRTFKGGGGSSQPADQRVISTDLPEYAEPYFRRLMQRGEAESLQGYTPYGGQRLAYFSPDELTSQAMARGFGRAGTPQEFTDASARYGAQGPIGGQFTQGPVSSGYVPGTTPTGYTAGQVGPGYQGATIGSGYQAGDFDPGYTAQTRDSRYGIGAGPAAYSPLGYEENIQRLMSPYQQNVTDIEKREAQRQSAISSKQLQDAAAVSGGLGGYREAIMQSERERNLGQQLGDIQQRGTQAAFENAQQQLERERAAGAGAAQFGLQRFGALEGAAQTQEQLTQAAFNAGQSARQQAAQMGLSAQQQEDAARQAQEQYSQSAFGASQQALQAAGTQGLQAYQAQEAAMQAQGAQSLQAYQAGEAARQEAAKLGLSAEQIEQAGRQAQEKFRQSAYDLSSRYNLQSAEGLMRAGQGIQQDAISRMSLLSDIGKQQRALRQAGLDTGYEDFMRQRDWTQRQLGMFGGLLKGVPVSTEQTVSTYQQQPGLFQTALGAGLSGLGLYKGMGSG